MYPSELLSVSRRDGVLLLQANGNGSLDILGTTVPSSFNQKPDSYSRRASSAAFFPEQGENGLIMVKVEYTEGIGKSMYQRSRTFMLGFQWNGATPEIVLNKEWIPRPGRIGQLQHDSFHAIVDGVLVQAVNQLPHNPDPEVVYIKDANILCKYLAGMASEEDVKNAPILENTSKTYREQAEQAQAQLSRTSEQLDRVREALEDQDRETERLRTSNSATAASFMAMTTTAQVWRDRARGLAAMVSKALLVRQPIKMVAEDILAADAALVKDLAD